LSRAQHSALFGLGLLDLDDHLRPGKNAGRIVGNAGTASKVLFVLKADGLTTTPCIERVKRLEREGVIRGYQATLNPDYLDAGLVVFVQIRLTRTSQDIFEEFKARASSLEEVQECYLVSGNFDYLIKARVADMHAYREFLGNTLL